MNTTLAVLLVASWIVILVALFLYERLDRRVAALSVQVQELVRMQRALMKHSNVEAPDNEVEQHLKQLVRDGKTYEAIVSYRTYAGVGYKEAKAYVDAIQSALSKKPSH